MRFSSRRRVAPGPPQATTSCADAQRFAWNIVKGFLLLDLVFHGGWILKAPVDSFGIRREHRTAFGRVITEGDHVIESTASERADRLWPEVARVEAVLCLENRLRERMDFGLRCASRAEHFDAAVRKVPEQRFRYLRPCRIPGAEEQHRHRTLGHDAHTYVEDDTRRRTPGTKCSNRP